jgi:hypothetical protein
MVTFTRAGSARCTRGETFNAASQPFLPAWYNRHGDKAAAYSVADDAREPLITRFLDQSIQNHERDRSHVRDDVVRKPFPLFGIMLWGALLLLRTVPPAADDEALFVAHYARTHPPSSAKLPRIRSSPAFSILA